MKYLIVLLFFLSISLTAQTTLYSDDNDVNVFYTIEKTTKSTSCKGNYSVDRNFSIKKINVWKVTLGIKNGYSQAIVPRGIGIANISVIPNPIKPYSSDYCRYNQQYNYESDESSKQSLFSWQIRDFKVNEIKQGETIINVTYLYLYDGQVPQLSNSQFLGYRLKEDFKSFDPLLVNTKEPMPTAREPIDYKPKETERLVAMVDSDATDIYIPETVISKANELLDTRAKIHSTPKAEPVHTTTIITPVPKNPVGEAITTLNAGTIKKVEPTVKKDLNAVSIKCPGTKALEYREKSNRSDDIEVQKAYSWLALYYTYKCECEQGSRRSDQLVAIINNVVDSYIANTQGGVYEKIVKVEKCKMPGKY